MTSVQSIYEHLHELHRERNQRSLMGEMNEFVGGPNGEIWDWRHFETGFTCVDGLPYPVDNAAMRRFGYDGTGRPLPTNTGMHLELLAHQRTTGRACVTVDEAQAMAGALRLGSTASEGPVVPPEVRRGFVTRFRDACGIMLCCGRAAEVRWGEAGDEEPVGRRPMQFMVFYDGAMVRRR